MTRHPAFAVTSHLLTSYRHTWLDSVFNSFFLPLCLLVGVGWSVGQHVEDSAGLGTSYFAFVGAGLLAATVTQIAAAESAWAVFGGFEWSRIYHAMRLTPARPADIMTGHLMSIMARAILGGIGFLLLLPVFGIAESWTTLAVIPLLPLIALAAAAPVMGFSASISNAGMFDVLFRLGILPMSLFSGVYFPLTTLPDALHAAALALPLTHAVALTRMLVLDSFDTGSALLHITCLTAWALAGLLFARRAFDRRLAD